MKLEKLATSFNVIHGFGLSDEPAPSGTCYLGKSNDVDADVVEIREGQTNIQRLSHAESAFSQHPCTIGVATADCVPVLVTSSTQPFIGVIHAGWRQLVSDIIGRSLSAYQDAGISLSDLQFGLGPAIGRCCYEIREDLVARIESAHGPLWKDGARPYSTERVLEHYSDCRHLAPGNADSYWLDLYQYIRILLTRAGISAQQVQTASVCTYCFRPAYGSYRRRQHQTEAKVFQRSWIALTN